MRDCTNCKFDEQTSNCTQGHFRDWRCGPGKYSERIPIQDCHAWKEKENKKCWCDYPENVRKVYWGAQTLEHYPGGGNLINWPIHFCLTCGKSLKKEMTA